MITLMQYLNKLHHTSFDTFHARLHRLFKGAGGLHENLLEIYFKLVSDRAE